MKVEIAFSNEKEGRYLMCAGLIFVVYQLASKYGEIVLGWFVPYQ